MKANQIKHPSHRRAPHEIYTMALDREIVGRFIDVAVEDPAEARRLAMQYPELRQARWLHDETVLHFLAVEGYADAVRLLVELGFDANAPNQFGDSPLIDVATLGNDEIAQALLAGSADPNGQSNTRDNVLHCAIRSGNPRLVELLLSAGADPTYVTDIGETAYDALPLESEARAAIEQLLSREGRSRGGDGRTT